MHAQHLVSPTYRKEFQGGGFGCSMLTLLAMHFTGWLAMSSSVKNTNVGLMNCSLQPILGISTCLTQRALRVRFSLQSELKSAQQNTGHRVMILAFSSTGNQACPITSGKDYAISYYGVWDMEWLKWIMAVCVICFWLIFTIVTHIGLRYMRHKPPAKPRIIGDISEDEEREMEKFNIKQVKQDVRYQKEMKKNKSKYCYLLADLPSNNSHIFPSSHIMLGEPQLGQEISDQLIDSGAYLSWHNLNYSVFINKGLKKSKLQLLHDISGYVKPGMMLALMVYLFRSIYLVRVPHSVVSEFLSFQSKGSSGAGKSTLMDVLARRKTGGKITGEILINGKKTSANLNRIIGYVEQQDIHTPTQTVLEALEFSAMVCAYFISLCYVLLYQIPCQSQLLSSHSAACPPLFLAKTS